MRDGGNDPDAIKDDIDHLREAQQHVAASPQHPADHFARAQAHALIDIAKSLRELVTVQIERG